MALYHFLSLFSLYFLVKSDFNYIVDHDEAPDYEALANLYSVDASIYVDSICTEYCDVSHVEVVQDS